jgi:hypothetical protein
VAVLLKVSKAVTVTLNGVPAVAAPGALTLKWEAAAGLTATVFEVPVIDEDTVSVPVMVRLPAVLRVALKVLVPLDKVELMGRTAAPSELVKWTVPA